jgi:hypothetical protein
VKNVQATRTIRAFQAARKNSRLAAVVVLAYALVMAGFWWLNSSSTFFGAPFAYLTGLLVSPFVSVTVDGAVITVAGMTLIVEDSCTAVFLAGTALVFVWIGLRRLWTGCLAAVSVLAVNTVRLVMVVLVLSYWGFPVAGLWHDGLYGAEVVLAVAYAIVGTRALVTDAMKAQVPARVQGHLSGSALGTNH